MGTKPPCVLFIEDDPRQQRLLKLLFRGQKIVSAIVGTCEDALRILRNPPQDLPEIRLVVTDGVIQGADRMSGAEFAEIVVREFRLPVVMVSASEARPPCVVELLEKPYNLTDLLALVARRLAALPPSPPNDA